MTSNHSHTRLTKSAGIFTFRSVLWVLTGALFFSCGNKTESKENALYFDIKTYMQLQVDSLQKENTIWLKTVISDGKKEEQTILSKNTDWKMELALFTEADLNKKAYQGKFDIDSSETVNSKTIRYRSANTKVKEFDIRYMNENRIWPEISGKISGENLFYESEYELNCEPFQYYSCRGFQKIKGWGKPKEFDISWKKKTD